MHEIHEAAQHVHSHISHHVSHAIHVLIGVIAGSILGLDFASIATEVCVAFAIGWVATLLAH